MTPPDTHMAGHDDADASVLVVDDDPTSRMLSRAALKDQMAVLDAENGLVAVQALERQRFDIVILDIDMPVMDGFGVLERTRARPETRHLPIIVVTGREDVVSIERAFALGATSFLCKPINWNVFRHQVSYVLKVARIERELRAANEQLERVALLRARGIAALGREIERAAESIGGLPDDGSAAFREVVGAGQRLRELLARIGRVSDVLIGRAGFSPRIVSAGEIASAAVRAVAESHGSPAADRVETFASERLDVLCDGTLVQEALVEVLKNALKASPPHEKIQLRIVDAAPGRVRFEILDRGRGIPEHLLESGIEELRSQQTASPSSERPELGLVFAKAIVDQHGGHFGILSEPDRGTEVFLSFPSAARDRRTDDRLADASGMVRENHF